MKFVQLLGVSSKPGQFRLLYEGPNRLAVHILIEHLESQHMQRHTHEPVTARAPSAQAFFLPHWRVKEVSQDGDHYDIVDSLGAVVASNVRSLELARLFALAPVIYENFKLLEAEAVRAFFQMLDVNEGVYDIAEVADDLDGKWEERSPGAPSTAGWLQELSEIREAVGVQRFPPSGVPCQGDLFEE